MKKIVALFLAAISTASMAATVGITSGTPAQEIRLSSGAFVSTSAWVRVGFFLNNNTAGLNDPTPAVLQTISSNFVPLGENRGAGYGSGTAATNTIAINGSTNSIGGGINDLTFGSGTVNTETAGSVPRGTKLYLLVYDSRDNPTELGIFSATTWQVPTSTLVNTANLTLTQVDTAGEVFRGSLGSLVLAPIVPEPSVGMMSILTGLIYLGRRRR